MSTLELLKERKPELQSWMETMHKNPELSMKEENTAKYIADTLRSFGNGIEIAEGIGKYGVVAILKNGDSGKSIGLRADFDALPIKEDNNLPYKSIVAGNAHLCGHDGHTTMLLGAAKYFAETKNFNGTVRFFFQPGEETMEGAPAMIADGLFEKFPVDSVYGMHNMPGLELGKFYFNTGKFMAAVDNWEIEITEKGSHGSMPELGIDQIVCGSAMVMAFQTIVSKNVPPWRTSVVNVGAFQSGIAGNTVPQKAILRLSIRNMDPHDRKMVLDKVRLIAGTQGESFNCQVDIREGIPGTVLVNSDEETHWAANVAKETFGEENVFTDAHPYMGSEDFAFMLEQKKGNYCMVGNGDTFMVHHPKYVFNQELLPLGARYWIALVENYLK